MPNVLQLKQRASELKNEVQLALKACEAGRITGKQLAGIMDNAEREDAELTSGINAYNKAKSYGGSAADERGQQNPPGGWYGKSADVGGSRYAKVKQHLPSPCDMTKEQASEIGEAGKRGYSLKSFVGGLKTKAVGDPNPATEGAPGSLLPWVLTDRLFQLPLEPTRISELIPSIGGTGPGAQYLQHTGNAASPAVVPELNAKPDIGIQLDEKQVKFSVIAGLASCSRQLFSDVASMAPSGNGTGWEGFIPEELHRAIVNYENKFLLEGDSDTGATGLNNTTGTLTRTYSSNTDTDDIDTIVKAGNDIRVGSAFGNADLVILHPDDWTRIRLTRSTYGLFLLSPDDPMTINGLDHIWGTRVVTTTQQTVGKATVLDSTKAALLFIREGLELITVGMGAVQTEYTLVHNAIQFRAELREGLAVPFPAAVNQVTLSSFVAGS
jgi:HK97 family phage major capsid protein